MVLDGELVAWDTDAGRLDFAGLQARLTAGRRLTTVVARRPAQMIAFDILAADGGDVRPLPLAERRAILEQQLHGLGSPIVLCQQSDDFDDRFPPQIHLGPGFGQGAPVTAVAVDGVAVPAGPSGRVLR